MSFGPSHPKTYSDKTKRPSNYVAGLGRGAVGFTTRSDIGPATMPKVPRGYQAGVGRGAGGLNGAATLGDDAANREGRDYSETSFDKFGGFSHALFNNTPYDKEDKEADEIYKSIDERMDSKRKKRREKNEEERRKKMRREKPRIADQFADLKKNLTTLTEDQWAAIPEIGDYSLNLKAKMDTSHDRSYAVPDSVILGTNQSYISKQRMSNTAIETGGFKTPMASANETLGSKSVLMSGLSQAREQLITGTLDKMSDSVTGQTVVDPKGYLTSMNSIAPVTANADINDIKKARLLMKSVTQTNPKHAPGWIAYARLEELAGRMMQARKLIRQACKACPDSEDVWIEASRLQTPQNAKIVLANAVRQIPRSVNIWMQAMKLEDDKESKRVVLRRALEFIPQSVKLWKAAVSLEDPEDAKIMLGRAVECIPNSVDLWLALARLSDYDNARKVLNAAREKVPTDQRIWVAAAKLEEANENGDRVPKIVEIAVKMLARNDVVLDRETWLKEAESAERAEAPLTAAAIVHATVGQGVEEQDRLRVWTEDANNLIARDSIETARAVLAHSLRTFPGRTRLWNKAVSLEQSHGTAESVEALLRRAVEHVPESQDLWLNYAKHKWRAQNDVQGARRILEDAFRKNQSSEAIWLAAVNLEWENGEIDRAKALLRNARTKSPTARIWMKSALLEWETSNLKEELKLLKQAIQEYPRYPKLWMMQAQAYVELEDFQQARVSYQKGLNHNPKCIALWQLSAELETEKRGIIKGRSLLVLARMKVPKSEDLWLTSVRLELKSGDIKTAKQNLAKGLQECPNSGKLWAMEIEMVPKKERKRRALDALKRCDNDPNVVCAVAKNFWRLDKPKKARKWFNRAVTLDEKLGDAWGYWYKFEVECGSDQEKRDGVLRRCGRAEPNRGEYWCRVAKRRSMRHAKNDIILKQVAEELPGVR